MKSGITALIAVGFLASCSAGHIEMHPLACPDVTTYTQAQQLAVHEELTKQGCNPAKTSGGECKVPMTLEFLIDGKILRDQARACHSLYGGRS